MYLWSKISFPKEKCKWTSHILIYMITLGWSWSLIKDLEKISWSRWFRAPTTLSPSILEELRMVWINDHEGLWMKRISKSFLFSKIILVRVLFFQTFCEKSQRFFKIIYPPYLQLSKLTCFYCHKSSDTFYVLLLIEVMFLEGADIRISLMITFAVQALEAVRIWFTLFSFQSGWISLEVCFIAPHKISMVLDFVGAIGFRYHK